MATYYVARTGKDTNSGIIESPWKTVNYGLAHIYAGDNATLCSFLGNVGAAGTGYTLDYRAADNHVAAANTDTINVR